MNITSIKHNKSISAKNIATALFLCIIYFTISGCATLFVVWDKVDRAPSDNGYDEVHATAEQIYLHGFTKENSYRYSLHIPYKLSDDISDAITKFPKKEEGILVVTNFNMMTSVMPFLSSLLSGNDDLHIEDMDVVVQNNKVLFRRDRKHEFDIYMVLDEHASRSHIEKYFTRKIKADHPAFLDDIFYESQRPKFSFSNHKNPHHKDPSSGNFLLNMPYCCSMYYSATASFRSNKEHRQVYNYLQDSDVPLKLSFKEGKDYLQNKKAFRPLIDKPFEFDLIFRKEHEYEKYKIKSQFGRIILTPFAVAFDTVTAPVQFFWLFLGAPHY